MLLTSENRAKMIILTSKDYWDTHVFIRRIMTLLQIHNTNSNNLYQIMRLEAYYEIHNSCDHSLNATYAKLSRKWNEVTECIGVQVSQPSPWAFQCTIVF